MDDCRTKAGDVSGDVFVDEMNDCRTKAGDESGDVFPDDTGFRAPAGDESGRVRWDGDPVYVGVRFYSVQ